MTKKQTLIRGQKTKGQTATLKHIFEKPDHSTPNGQNFQHATPNVIKPVLLER
jgi:hypothetical protein